MTISVPIVYELNGDVPYLTNGTSNYYSSTIGYYEAIEQVITGLKEIDKFEGVSDHERSYYIGSYDEYAFEYGHSKYENNPISINSIAINDFGILEDELVEGDNLNTNDITTNNVLIKNDFTITLADGTLYAPEVGDEFEIDFYGNINFNREKFGSRTLKVKGIYDYSRLYKKHGIASDILLTDIQAEDHLNNLIEAYTAYESNYYKEAEEKAYEEMIASEGNSFYVPALNFEADPRTFMIKEANYTLGNNVGMLDEFKGTADKLLRNKLATIGNNSLNDVYFLKADSSSDISNIIEPFQALRNNLDSSILAILVFCVIMLIISSIYMINSRQKEMMIRSALGEKRKRQFLQYLIENSVISFITTTIAYILNITIISKVIEAMFKRSIETQNDLKRIATGELGAFDELYELSRYNILNIQITDYFVVLGIVMTIVCISSALSFLTQKKIKYRTLLNN